MLKTVEWGQRRFNARGYPHSDVQLERASPEVRGAHYAGRSPRGALINSERASIWVQASSSSASPTRCRWKETRGDANLTSEYMDAFVVCSTESKFMSRAQCFHAYAFVYFSDRIRAAAMRCWEVALWRMDCLCIVSTKVRRHPYACLHCSAYCLEYFNIQVISYSTMARALAYRFCLFDMKLLQMSIHKVLSVYLSVLYIFSLIKMLQKVIKLWSVHWLGCYLVRKWDGEWIIIIIIISLISQRFNNKIQDVSI